MKNEGKDREKGSKASMWSLNLRKSGEENQTRNARGGGKESKAIEQYAPLFMRGGGISFSENPFHGILSPNIQLK